MLNKPNNICPYCQKDLSYLFKKDENNALIATDVLEHLIFCCQDEDGFDEI